MSYREESRRERKITIFEPELKLFEFPWNNSNQKGLSFAHDPSTSKG